MSTTQRLTLRDWAKKNKRTRLSHSIQEGKDTGFMCIFAANKDNPDDVQVIMISKGLAKEVKKGDLVKPLWDNPITEGSEEKAGHLYLGRKTFDDIEDDDETTEETE